MDWNKVNYCDCLDKTNGLPSLPDKSIDVCFTDPPFNVKFKGKEDYKNTKERYYHDKNLDYKGWCALFLKELKRVCNIVLIHCGKTNINLWYEIEPPYDMIFWYVNNAQPSPGRASWLTMLHPVLCYGKFGKRRLNKDLFTYPMKIIKGLTHPCPLNVDFVKEVLSQLKPTSVIDPFMGSGTTAGACNELKIPWIGYEIDKEFEKDIIFRLKEPNL